MAKSECITQPLGDGRDLSTSTAQRRAVAANDALNVIAPLAEALSRVVEHVSNYDLTTEAGAEKAARFVQLQLAARGWYIERDPAAARVTP